VFHVNLIFRWWSLKLQLPKKQDVSQSSYRITAQYIDVNEVHNYGQSGKKWVYTSSFTKILFRNEPIELEWQHLKRWTVLKTFWGWVRGCNQIGDRLQHHAKSMSELLILLVAPQSLWIGYAAHTSWSSYTNRVVIFVCSQTLPNLFCCRCHLPFVAEQCHWYAPPLRFILADVMLDLRRKDSLTPQSSLLNCLQAVCPRCWPRVAQSVHRCVCPLVPPELSHWRWRGSTQSSNLPLLVLGLSIASVFWDKWPSSSRSPPPFAPLEPLHCELTALFAAGTMLTTVL